jgi:hypothetical protein
MTFTHYTAVERDEEQVELTCEVEYYRAYRGMRDGRYGPPIEPDEPAHCELSDWTPAIDLTDAEISRIEEEAFESFTERNDD